MSALSCPQGVPEPLCHTQGTAGLPYLFKKDIHTSRWLQKLSRALKLLEGKIACKGDSIGQHGKKKISSLDFLAGCPAVICTSNKNKCYSNMHIHVPSSLE